jgi:nuclear pore complex protein Nup160
MTRTYIPHTLVHAHLPAPPTIPDSIPELHVSSEYQDPAPTTDDIFPEHALSFSYNPALNVLARVINNGYTLELRSFSTVYDPSSASDRNDAGSDIVRVFFPRPIKALPENSVIVSTLDRRVYIMVYTEGITPHAELGTLYRLNFALGGAKVGRGHRFNFTTRGNDDWVEEVDVPEDVLRSCGGISTWAAVDELNAVLGGNDGGIVRLVRSNRDVRNRECSVPFLTDGSRPD